MSRSDQEAICDVREWSGRPSGCPGLVGRPSRMTGSGLEALQHIRKWSGGPPGCQ